MRKFLPHIWLLFSLASSSCMYAQTAAPTVAWQKCIGGSKEDKGYAMVRSRDGGYVIAGTSKSNDGQFNDNRDREDFAILKTDSLGNIKWLRNFGGDRNDIATSVIRANEGGYLVAGYSNSSGGDVLNVHRGSGEATDYWVVKVTEDGFFEWQTNFGGSDYEYGYAVENASDGGYIMVGMSSSNDGDITNEKGNADCWIVKFDRIGFLQWQRSVGGVNADVGKSIKATPDGGYIIAGYTFSSGGDITADNHTGNIWVLKISSAGNMEWQQYIGGSSTDYGYDISLTNDGGYILTGTVFSNNGVMSGNHGKSDCFVAKLAANGKLQWSKCFGGANEDAGNAVRHLADGSYIVAGSTKSNDGDITGAKGDSDGWILKLSANGNLEWQRSLGGSGADQIAAVLINDDGSYMVLGATQSNDGDVSGNHSSDADIWLAKLECLPVMPSVTIMSSQNPVCSGYYVDFTADIKHGGTDPFIQWMRNGISVGTNKNSFQTNELAEGDKLYCILTSSESCAIDKSVSSDTMIMHVKKVDPAAQPRVLIQTNTDSICKGETVQFNASTTHLPGNTSFTWTVNGLEQDSHTNVFKTSSLIANDEVQVVVQYANECGNEVLSNTILLSVKPAATVVAMNDTTVSSGSSIKLHATITGNYQSIKWINEQGVIISTLVNPVVIVDKTTHYAVEVINNNGCISNDQVFINLLDQLNIPNAFSPNNDGINDTWIVRGLDVAENFRVRIFDRFGRTVADYKGNAAPWDGTKNGKMLPDGTYYYIISNKKGELFKGSLLLLR